MKVKIEHRLSWFKLTVIANLISALAFCIPNCSSAEPDLPGKIMSCSFKTKTPPPVFKVSEDLAIPYLILQQGLRSMPEGTVIKVILQGGMSAHQATNLCIHIDRAYSRISSDPNFQGIESALPYCFSETRQTEGHYFLYCPSRFDEKSRVIVFLHGFGGNFQCYLWSLKKAFPNSIILVPSWCISWRTGSMQYLMDMRKDAKQRLGISLGKPWLFAISDGGPAAFRIYNDYPDDFKGLVSIASTPDSTMIPELRKELRILMINGRYDKSLPLQHVEETADALEKRLPHFELRILNSDHFFFLSERSECFNLIEEFMEQTLRDDEN